MRSPQPSSFSSHGAAFGSPLFVSAHRPEPGARHPIPQHQETSHDQHNRVHRRTYPRPQRRLPPHLRRRHGHDHRRRRSHAASINVASLLAKVRAFDVFTDDNDPHGEHDFGAVDEGGVRCFWKIDCYDRATEIGSPDPADPAVTTRVLTIMRADEY